MNVIFERLKWIGRASQLARSPPLRPVHVAAAPRRLPVAVLRRASSGGHHFRRRVGLQVLLRLPAPLELPDKDSAASEDLRKDGAAAAGVLQDRGARSRLRQRPRQDPAGLPGGI